MQDTQRRAGLAAVMAGVVVAVTVAANGGGTHAHASPLGKAWQGQTKAVLAAAMVPGSPFPSIVLPRDQQSVYDFSVATIAARTTGIALTPEQASRLARIISAHWNGAAHLYDSPDDGDPLMVTWYALRALDDSGQLASVQAGRLAEIGKRAAADVARRRSGHDAFDRVYAYRVAAFVAAHGPAAPAAAAAAAAALAETGPDLDCSAAAEVSDPDLWGAYAEMTQATKRTCASTAPVTARFDSEAAGLQRRLSASPAQLDPAALARLQSLQVIAAVYGLDAALLGSSVRTVGTLARQDAVGLNPVALATTADSLGAARTTMSVGPRGRGALGFVLTWGSAPVSYAPDAQLYVLAALTAGRLPGSPDTGQLAAAVHWQSVSGLDRMALATWLNPGMLHTADFPDAIADQARIHATARQAPPGVGGTPATPGPSGPSAAGAGPAPAPEALDTRTRAAISTIATAATISHQSCSGPLRSWADGSMQLIEHAAAELPSAPSKPLLDVVRFLGFARGCPELAAASARLQSAVLTRTGQLDQAAATTPDDRNDVLELWATTELDCALARTPRIDIHKLERVASSSLGKDGGISGDGEVFSLWRTYAVVRTQQLLVHACGRTSDGGAS